MPPKKAVKQPVRQLTKPTATPARRRPAGTATVDLGTPDAPVLPADGGTVDPAATRNLPPVPPPAARPMPGRPAAAPMPRRQPVAPAASGLRALRGRVAQQVQTMDLREEMAWIRSDIVRLSILATLGFVILIVLAIVLPMFGL